MKPTDWYTRLMLSIVAGSSVYLAATLRTATQEAAAFYARMPQSISAGPVALPAVWRTPVAGLATSSIDAEPINVRIVGYRYKDIRQGNYVYDDREFGMGHYGVVNKATVANELPVCTNCK